MTLLDSLKCLAETALANVVDVFTPKTLPTSFEKYEPRESRQMERSNRWWRSRYLAPAMQHSLANDKALMLAENPVLRGLIARHFKVV